MRPHLDIQQQLRAVADQTSLRSAARTAGISLSSVQRVISGTPPTLRTLTKLGLALGLRLEAKPLIAEPRTVTRATPPSLPYGRGQAPAQWRRDEWIDESTHYLNALMGLEIRHCRRSLAADLAPAATFAGALGVQPITLRRLEQGTGSTTVAVADLALAHTGLELFWAPLGSPWRIRPFAPTNARNPAEPDERMRRARRVHGAKAAMRTNLDDTWRTPPDLVDAVTAEFGQITLDAAARPGDNVVPEWLGPNHPDPHRRDALRFSPPVGWADIARRTKGDCEPHIFLNPPFGRPAASFIERAVATAQNGVPVTAVLPARVDTKLFHDLVFPNASEVRFLRGRVRYVRSDGRFDAPAPFPTALIRFQ